MKKKIIIFSSLLLFGLLSFFGFSQLDTPKLQTECVRDNIYMLSPYGGNVAVLKGEESSLMIDSKFPKQHDLIVEFLKDENAGPIKYLLNTNFHYDHISGNELFAKEGAIIIMHERSREQMLNTWLLPELQPDLVIEAWPEMALPIITVKQEFKMHFNGQQIEATHFINAHSDGDLVFYFKQSNVMHTGDIVINYPTTFINISSGGGIEGVIAAIKEILKITNEETLFIPGHGSIMTYANVNEHLTILMAYRDAMKKLIAEGKSFEDVKKNPLAWADYSADDPKNFKMLSYFSGLIYQDLTGFYKK